MNVFCPLAFAARQFDCTCLLRSNPNGKHALIKGGPPQASSKPYWNVDRGNAGLKRVPLYRVVSGLSSWNVRRMMAAADAIEGSNENKADQNSNWYTCRHLIIWDVGGKLFSKASGQ